MKTLDMKDWNTMETAPRDGTHVLLIRANEGDKYGDAGKRYLSNAPHCFVAKWFDRPSIFPVWPARWVTPHEGAGPWLDHDFTGWLPLPEDINL